MSNVPLPYAFDNCWPDVSSILLNDGRMHTHSALRQTWVGWCTATRWRRAWAKLLVSALGIVVVVEAAFLHAKHIIPCLTHANLPKSNYSSTACAFTCIPYLYSISYGLYRKWIGNIGHGVQGFVKCFCKSQWPHRGTTYMPMGQMWLPCSKAATVMSMFFGKTPLT